MLSNRPLVRKSPESQGVSSRKLLDLIHRLDATDNEIHGFMVARNDCVIAESWLKPYSAQYPHTCHSLGKSYTCTAAGIACTEGLLSTEDRIVDLFAEEISLYGITPDANFQKLKVRDVMAMGNGMPGMPAFDESWLENYLKSPVIHEPGTQFQYNTVGSCVLGAVVEKAVGKGILEYLREKLFSKIGIGQQDLVWLRFANQIYAEPGVSATTESNLRLGLFYLARGRAAGEQIISADWIKAATSKQIETSQGTEDYRCGYGWQLWMSGVPGLYRFDGGQGQLCLMDPARNAVVAMHEGGRDPLGVQQTITLAQDFLTEMGDGVLPEDPQAWGELKEYLNNRALPEAKACPVPSDAEQFDGVYHVTGGHPDFWMEVIPVDEDFYHLFYDPYVDRTTKLIEFRLHRDYMMMTINGRSEFKLILDGRQQAFDTIGVIPQLPKTCSTAYFEDAATLVVSIRWLNGWMCSETRFTLDGPNLTIETKKDMLHEGKEPVLRQGTARKIGL